MDNREYLKHIKIAQTEEASYLFLERLVSQHLIRVPFENLDILHGKEIVLDMKAEGVDGVLLVST